jgi:gliding motility-associated-like protein
VTLYISNDNNCEDEISKIIYVNADLFVHIPNAFSPNGDGVNDTYGLSGLTQGVAQMTMDIYNRWGEKVFHSEDTNKTWDGQYKGAPAQQGVYLYVIRFTNPKQTQWYYYNGEIHLLR